MRHSFLLLLTVVVLSLSAKAQVGIGNSVPAIRSILDLTNSGQKFFVLPKATGIPDASVLDTAAALIYYQGNIYLRGVGNEINAFSPWKWDGDATHPFYVPDGMPVGIGFVIPPLAPAYLNYRLQIANASSDIGITSPLTAPLLIGDVNGKHLVIDDDEIMAKSAPTTGGLLKLQEEDGTVAIRSSTSDAGTTNVLTAYGSSNATGRVREKGNDLLPAGSIIMWGGLVSAIPAGWILCDGGASPPSLTAIVGTNLPDLRERFIVGLGVANTDNGSVPGTNSNGYLASRTGGENTHVLTIAEMPTHNHGGTTTGSGNHEHDYFDYTDSQTCRDGVFAGQSGCYMTKDATTPTMRTTPLVNQAAPYNTFTKFGSHTHTISNEGSGAAHENRPPFYALAFIMKL